MSVYTVTLSETSLNPVTLSDGTSFAVLQVAAGRGPKGDGWTGVTYDTNTGRFTFTSNDGLGYVSDDITVDLDAAVAAAEAAQTAAEAAEANTISLFDQFGDQYLGPKASDPTVDNDGDPLTDGDIYFNTTDNVLKFYTGTAWVAPEAVATTAATDAQTAQAAAEAAQTAAETAETNAATSEANTAALLDQFDDRYLGSKTSDPTLDNDGNALLTGALYFSTTENALKVYTGSVWSSSMFGANNLSEITDAAVARTNLDVDQAGTAVALAIALG